MAQMPRLSARRLVPSALIALLLGAGFVAAAGAASSGQTGEAPQSISIPQARIGDSVEYEVEFIGPWQDIVAPPLRFEWKEGPAIAGRTGQVVETDLVLMQEPRFGIESPENLVPTWRTDNRTLLFLQGAPRLEAVVSDFDWETAVVDPGVLGLLSSSHTQTLNGTWTLFWDSDACLPANPFQGSTLSVDAPTPFPATCSLPPGYAVKEPTTWSITPELLGDAWTLRLHQAAEGKGITMDAKGVEGKALDAWFADGVAYPVRLELHWPAIPWLFQSKDENPAPTIVEIPAFSVRLSLVAFSRGTVERGQPETIAAPTVDERPRLPWGPDDTGIAHPFPLSEAYAKAKDDLQFTGLRDFLRDHPKAVVTEADSYGGEVDGEAYWVWRFDVQDQSSAFNVHARKQVRNEMEQAWPGLGHTVARYSFSGGPGLPFYPIDADNAPATMPTVQWLAGQWQAHAASQDNPNRWGFKMTCDRPDECNELEVEHSVALADTRMWLAEVDPGAPGLSQGVESSSITLRISNGTAVAFFASTGRLEEATPLAAAPAGADREGAPFAAPRTAARFALDPVTLTGAGSLALVGGLLYWLWPALKAGAIGLFSRLREPELLQSPQRRRIMDLVEAQPGIHFKELLRQTGLPNGSLVHHVGQLQKAGLLVAKPSNGYTCYFPRGPADAERAALLKADGARQVLAAVQASPGLSGLEVAHLTGLQPSTVNYHAKRLADAGLLSPVRDGRAVRLHPRTDASSAKA